MFWLSWPMTKFFILLSVQENVQISSVSILGRSNGDFESLGLVSESPENSIQILTRPKLLKRIQEIHYFVSDPAGFSLFSLSI